MTGCIDRVCNRTYDRKYSHLPMIGSAMVAAGPYVTDFAGTMYVKGDPYR